MRLPLQNQTFGTFIQSNLLYKFVCIAAFFVFAFLTIACSDSETDGKIAGSVTDIENSVATVQISGTVLNKNGNAVPSARVVVFYDSWEQSEASDSVEVNSDETGNFVVKIDSSKNAVLYAENKDECVLAAVDSSVNKLILGTQKSLTSSVNGATSGYVRVVGTNEIAEIDSAGNFKFDALPPGDIILSYFWDEKPQGHLDFKTTDERDSLFLPPMNFCEDGRPENPDFKDEFFGVNFRPHGGWPNGKPPKNGWQDGTLPGDCAPPPPGQEF